MRPTIKNGASGKPGVVHGIAKALGERLPKSTTPAMAKRVREEGFADLFPGMSSLLEVVELLSEQIRELDSEIEKVSKERYPETELVRQVKGVGPITSLAYVLTIEDPARFARSRSVGVYLGMRPRQRDSGDHTSRLTKRGIPTYETYLWNALSTFCREAQTAICVASVNVL